MSRLRADWTAHFHWNAVLTALFAGLAFLGMLTWAQAEQQKRELSREQVFWKLFASSYFELHGGWERFEERLSEEMGKREADSTYRISVWDAQGDPVAAGEDREEYRQSPIMVNGSIVGRIGIIENRRMDLTEPLIGALVIFCVTFFMMDLVMRRHLKRMKAELRMLSGYAYHIAATNHREDSPPGDETLMQTLERIQAKVNQLDHIRQTMMADIAHELRTPIAVIRAQLDNALAAGQSWGSGKLLMVQDEIYRVSALIHDMQELTMAETQRLHLDKQWFDVRAILDMVIETMTMEGEEAGIVLERHGEEECLLYADEKRIRQILINLVGNAIKHARSRVTVDSASDSHQVTIVVRDDGMGMEEEELPRVFDRFYRGANSRKGLGLGLAIAKEYAAAHGGRIGVVSRWGEGASFALIVPVFRES